MPFGQTVFATTVSLGLTRRTTYLVSRALGKPVPEAAQIADDVAITAASVVGTAVAIITADLLGWEGSMAYLALEARDAEDRHKRQPS